MENKGHLFITGATGFVSSRLLPQLQDRRCLILEHRTKFQSQNGCTVCKIEDLDRLRGVSQVLHLGAKIRGNRNEIYQVNFYLTERLISFCKSQNAKMFFLSTINVRLKHLNAYAQSKLDAENVIMNSGINYQIIRPAYLFEPTFEVNLVNFEPTLEILKWIPYLPRLPFEAIVQPLAVEELSHLVLKLLNHNITFLNPL